MTSQRVAAVGLRTGQEPYCRLLDCSEAHGLGTPYTHLVPPLNAEQRAALRTDIAKRGIKVPIAQWGAELAR